MSRPAAALFAALVAGVALTSCESAPTADAGADPLAQRVTISAMTEHLQRLQQIADAHGGNRADGSSGYDASVDYVVQTLQDNGFDVQIPEFDRLVTTAPGNPTLTVGTRAFQVDQASQLSQTPEGGIAGPVLKPRSSGCAAADYPQVPPGSIAVVDADGCSVIDKARTAVAQQAAGLVVINAGGRRSGPVELFPHDYYGDLLPLGIPVAVAGEEAGAAMRTGSQVRLVLDSVANQVRSRNIVAQTKTGSRDDVVMVGAHLDSVAGGPGINDNGSGVAAVLETAVQLGAAPQLNNAVRFAFWGGEETGLTGSSGYLYGLDQAALNDVALYLNADMLGSPNAGFFSFIAPEANSAPGESTGVARALADAIRRFGREPVMSATLGRTDIRGFLTAGVPVGSLSTGADELKSNAQQQMWGGTAGQPFDPNYHGTGDTMSNINAETLAVMGRALAYAVGRYAESISGDDGVPGRSERNRPGLGGHR